MTPSENFELLRELLRGIDTDVVEPEELLRQDRKELGKAPHKAPRHQVRDPLPPPFSSRCEPRTAGVRLQTTAVPSGRHKRQCITPPCLGTVPGLTHPVRRGGIEAGGRAMPGQ